MKDTKSIIAARVALGATTVKNVVFENVTVLEEDENGRATVIIRVSKDVPAMVQTSARMIDKAERNLNVLKNAMDDAVKAVETATKKADKITDATKKQEALDTIVPLQEAADAATEAYNEAKADFDAMEEDAWTKGVSNTIFTSNYELLAILRQDPRTVVAAKLAQNAPELLEALFIGAKGSVLCEDVEHDTEYCSPFSENTSPVNNDSVYHTLYGVSLGDEGEDTLDELKREHRKMLLKKALSGKTASRRRRDDDEDDED